MEELDLGKELPEFYEKNKENKLVLSKEEVRKETKRSLFSFSDYALDPEKVFRNNLDDVVFGFKTGLCFTNNSIIACVNISTTKSKVIKYTFDEINYKIDVIEEHPVLILGIGKYEKKIPTKLKQYNELIKLINDELLNKIKIKIETFEAEKRKQAAEKLQKREQQRIENLNVSQDNILKELDKDGKGEVDVVEGNDFSLLLKKHQKSIIEIDRTYVQQFVKVSSYLKTKKNNVQLIFNSIKDTSSQEELNEYVGILKNEIQTYSLILFNSLNMIVSLVEDDMITFYEIHESFDKLNIFNSNWENEMSQKLSNIGDGLSNLMYSIEEMGQNIANEIGELSYVTEESNRMLSNQLQDIDSSLQTNNLLTGIQTYQMYKINKNTKGLRE